MSQQNSSSPSSRVLIIVPLQWQIHEFRALTHKQAILRLQTFKPRYESASSMSGKSGIFCVR